MPSGLLPLIVVLGPTGAGKSELAVSLASAFNGEIVNYDSVQVYRGLDVGSAKPSPTERNGVPHHLLDILDVTDELTAGAFATRARQVLSELKARNRLPFLVGGTGFYLRALLDGLSPAPPRDEALRIRLASLAERRPSALHRFLRASDPVAAKRIHPNDRQKLMRAIELTILVGRPASETQAQCRQALEGYAVLQIGLSPPRAELHQRLNLRAARMFEGGLLSETKAILDHGIPPQAKPLLSLGYKQAVAYLTEHSTIENAIGECQAKTRQYAKRQMTWFRGNPGVRWLHGFGSEQTVQQQAQELTRKFLTTGLQANVADKSIDNSL